MSEVKTYSCPACNGMGELDVIYPHWTGDPQRERTERETCQVCDGEREITFEEWQAWEIEYPIPYYVIDEQATAGGPETNQ